MYLEIIVLGRTGKPATFFIGPFVSEEARLVFRELWEGRLQSEGYNPNRAKFLSQDKLPEGWGAVLPQNFPGFAEIR